MQESTTGEEPLHGEWLEMWKRVWLRERGLEVNSEQPQEEIKGLKVESDRLSGKCRSLQQNNLDMVSKWNEYAEEKVVKRYGIGMIELVWESNEMIESDDWDKYFDNYQVLELIARKQIKH